MPTRAVQPQVCGGKLYGGLTTASPPRYAGKEVTAICRESESHGWLPGAAYNFHVRAGCVWIDEGLAIPIPLRRRIINQMHSYHHKKASMFDTARDIWFPYIHWKLASAAEGCAMCTEAGKNLKSLCRKKRFRNSI